MISIQISFTLLIVFNFILFNVYIIYIFFVTRSISNYYFFYILIEHFVTHSLFLIPFKLVSILILVRGGLGVLQIFEFRQLFCQYIHQTVMYCIFITTLYIMSFMCVLGYITAFHQFQHNCLVGCRSLMMLVSQDGIVDKLFINCYFLTKGQVIFQTKLCRIFGRIPSVRKFLQVQHI